MSEFDQTFLLAFILGLLGFVEPCTIGSHLLFLAGQRNRPVDRRLGAVIVFMTARVLMMGGFGGAVALLGQRLIGVQTNFWLIFGSIYLVLGITMIARADRYFSFRINAAPEHWKAASNPTMQGLAFGLNIPACAAPILFGLIGTASASGSAATGFVMMSIFALALSLPLVLLTVIPRFVLPFDRLADWLRTRRWLLGALFIVLGLWSIWFGLFVDPADWSTI